MMSPKPTSAADRKAALARRSASKPCRVCKRATLSPTGICDRHPKTVKR